MGTRNRAIGVLLATAVLTGCASDAVDDGRLSVVATTTVLGDIVREIVGTEATVSVLMSAGVDPHDFNASSRQVAQIARADLVVSTGLGLEGSLVDVIESAAAAGAVSVEVGPLVGPRTIDGEDDPHFWMDPSRVVIAVDVIAAALDDLAPGHDWSGRASAYQQRIRETDARMAALFASLEPSKRVLVTDHDSFGYLAERYDFTVLGVVVSGGSTLANPSSSELAALVSVIDQEALPAIFGEVGEPLVLMEAVADEAQADVEIVELFNGSLGPPGSGAETLIDMWLLNATRIVAALGGTT